MNDKPRRRFWQIHLSTAVVLMFVAGGVVWLNTLPRAFSYISVSDTGGSPEFILKTGHCVGWPYPMYSRDGHQIMRAIGDKRYSSWDYSAASNNAIVAAVALTAVAWR